MGAETGGECPFCAAAGGQPATQVLYETPDVLALFPLGPATLGHTLVLPRRHVPDLWALSATDARPLTEAVLRVAHAVREALHPDGLNVITSAGRAASQTVMHLHVHVVPRWEGDAIGDLWPRRGPAFAHEALDRAAESIRATLG
ncbi:HIT family protein [Micromonospora sp. CPCC 206061]|uniref:HIT family protein n=1 Tax=Micromonospora sp. CPCC 206061 TaxID=3122410 RepID=UPI002FEF4722